MTKRVVLRPLLLAALAIVFYFPSGTARGENPATPLPSIFPKGVDAKAAVQKAVVQAKAENKLVLLMFGADWCPWCHRLHHLFQSDPGVAALLAKRFVFVMVDAGERKSPLNQGLINQYGLKPYGLPALVVLDADGRPLSAQSSGVLEEGKGHSPAKVTRYLLVQLGENDSPAKAE